MAVGEIILGGLQVLGGLFGGGQVYGADFDARKQKIQGWMYTYGLAGASGKYIDQNVLQSYATEDSTQPSPYTRAGGIWQNDVQRYFAEISNVLAGRQGNQNEQAYYSMVKNYIDSVNSGNSTGGGSGVVILPPDGSGTPNQSGFNSTYLYLIIVGIFVTMILTGVIKL